MTRELGEVRKAVLAKLQCGAGPEPTDDPLSSSFLVTGYYCSLQIF
jgi:hypothetical protein